MKTITQLMILFLILISCDKNGVNVNKEKTDDYEVVTFGDISNSTQVYDPNISDSSAVFVFSANRHDWNPRTVHEIQKHIFAEFKHFDSFDPELQFVEQYYNYGPSVSLNGIMLDQLQNNDDAYPFYFMSFQDDAITSDKPIFKNEMTTKMKGHEFQIDLNLRSFLDNQLVISNFEEIDNHIPGNDVVLELNRTISATETELFFRAIYFFRSNESFSVNAKINFSTVTNKLKISNYDLLDIKDKLDLFIKDWLVNSQGWLPSQRLNEDNYNYGFFLINHDQTIKLDQHVQDQDGKNYDVYIHLQNEHIITAYNFKIKS